VLGSEKMLSGSHHLTVQGSYRKIPLIRPSSGSHMSASQRLNDSDTGAALTKEAPAHGPLQFLKEVAKYYIDFLETARHILIRVHVPRNLLASMNTGLLRAESDATFLRGSASICPSSHRRRSY
jgi:hypothetical protein